MNINPLLMIDGYKTDHRRQYPVGTTLVYSNMTPRKSRVEGVEKVVFFGLQWYVKDFLIDCFNRDFFSVDLDKILKQYKDGMDKYLGKDAVPVDHVADLHKLGYLPIKVKALPEGTRVPIKCPMLTIVNTKDEFFWLTNQLETSLSACVWPGCTSATTAYEFRTKFNRVAEQAGIHPDFVKFQGHDFSFRGLMGLQAPEIVGAGFLTSFAGTDTYPAIEFINKFYTQSNDATLVGASVPATEHSCMCMGTEDAEIGTYKRLINEVYPRGIVSIVSDTWDFWSIMTTGLRELKNDILKREGKVVFRPDSGDPVLVVCGDPDAPEGTPERKGAFECLWDVFGGTINDKGFKQLDSHVGLIYGDSITRDRQDKILEGLMKKGFVPDVVLGVGSYSLQYVTRDTYGFAVKATYGVVNGQPREIYKSPKTDQHTEKKSAKGLLRVDYDKDGTPFMTDQVSLEQESGGALELVFEDSKLCRDQSIEDIRARLHSRF